MGNFAQMLKELRTKRHLTQVELAKHLNISRSSIGMYEKGEREPDFETLETIADFFNVDMNYLLGKTPDDELSEYLDELHKRPEMKMLFKVVKNASKEDIEKAVKIIEMFKGNDSDDI